MFSSYPFGTLSQGLRKGFAVTNVMFHPLINERTTSVRRGSLSRILFLLSNYMQKEVKENNNLSFFLLRREKNLLVMACMVAKTTQENMKGLEVT